MASEFDTIELSEARVIERDCNPIQTNNAAISRGVVRCWIGLGENSAITASARVAPLGRQVRR
ncbi:MAG: hypothetical protein DWI09_13105, partial [Planctomycetota bacterium]